MSKILSTLSAIGALVMAATPLVAAGGVAHAAEADQPPSAHLVGPLNQRASDGAAAFRHRVDLAADGLCTARRETGLGARIACRDAVRQEAVERLSDAQRGDLRSAEAAAPTSWAVATR